MKSRGCATVPAMASLEEIKRLAALSRLSFSEEELPRFAKDIDTILAYVGKLETFSLASDTKEEYAHRNVFREDIDPHEKGKYTETLTNAFPEKSGDLLKVKRILPND